jgi:hypothetical protein
VLPIFQTYISIWCFLGFLIVILILISKLEILRVVRLFAAIYVFAPHVSAIPFQMAHFIQLLRRRMTKTSNMLPAVAAVLPAEKLNETLVK